MSVARKSHWPFHLTPSWNTYEGSGWGIYGRYSGEREARYACVDRAEQTGNRANRVRSVNRDGRD